MPEPPSEIFNLTEARILVRFQLIANARGFQFAQMETLSFTQLKQRSLAFKIFFLVGLEDCGLYARIRRFAVDGKRQFACSTGVR